MAAPESIGELAGALFPFGFFGTVAGELLLRHFDSRVARNRPVIIKAAIWIGALAATPGVFLAFKDHRSLRADSAMDGALGSLLVGGAIGLVAYPTLILLAFPWLYFFWPILKAILHYVRWMFATPSRVSTAAAAKRRAAERARSDEERHAAH